MNELPSAREVEEVLKAYLLGKGSANPFVNVMEMSDKTGQRVYVISVQPPLASILQPFLEARLDQHCPYVLGSFLLHGEQAKRLLS